MYQRKQQQLARIRPHKILSFFAKDSSPPTAWLSITNTTDSRIAFKIKTTSPESYQVDSHRGLIEARTCVDIPVILKRDGHCTVQNDRFAILIMRVGDERKSKSALDNRWSCAVRDKDPDVFMEQRMRCTLIPYSFQDPACGRGSSSSRLDEGLACLSPCDGEGDETKVKQPKCLRVQRPIPPTSWDDGDADDGCCKPDQWCCKPVPAQVVEAQQRICERLNSMSKVNTVSIASIIVILIFLFFIHFHDHSTRVKPPPPCCVDDCCQDHTWYTWLFGCGR